MGSPGYYLSGSSLNYNISSKKSVNHINKKSNLYGYSVSSGNFYNEKRTNFIKSSPFAGEVTIFNKPHTNGDMRKFSRKIEEIKSDKVGVGFGYCLATGDIDADHLDDIVVGAPFYKSKSFNEGAVYVYLGSKTGKMQTPNEGHVIMRNHPNGHFGMAVMFLNDIDADGFGDVAVAAPFQDNGVVYIYHGTAKGLNPSPAQAIEGKSVYQNLQGFGFSFSKPCDVFNKNVSDLAIGSFLSGHAVILRGRPVVIVTTSLVSIPPYLNKNATEFILQVTYVVENRHNPNQTMENIILRRSIEMDPHLKRTNFSPSTKNITVIVGTTYNENITVKIDNTIKEPIPVKLTYVFLDKELKKSKKTFIKNETTNNFRGDLFCPSCPIIDKKRSSGPIAIPVNFNLECGDDNICQSNLTMELRLLDLHNNTYNVGTNKKSFVTLEVDIQNSGEFAYSNELMVKLPRRMKLQKEDMFCNLIKNETKGFNCSLIRPIVGNSSKQVKFDLDLKEAISGSFSGPLLITVDLKTKHENEKRKEITLNIVRDADIYLDGRSRAYKLNKRGSTNFTQTYRVVKEGSSPIGEVEVSLTFPSSISQDAKTFTQFIDIQIPNKCKNLLDEENSFSKKKEVLQLDRNTKLKELNSSKHIEVSSSLYPLNIAKASRKIKCIVGPFDQNVHDESINFTMQLNQSALFDALGGPKKQILFESYGEAKIIPSESDSEFIETGNRSNKYTVSTVFLDKLEAKDISIWYVVAAVITGILLLLILVVILIKLGFFERKTKEKLEKLKDGNSVLLRNGNNSASNDDLLSNDNLFTPLPDNLGEANYETPEETSFEGRCN
ncbi:unnamed protein product [Brassicogethes aeneus]|uniref:Integrin alpha second immunoglobulin-like domain-containing protein n=1 Tax=Brassicogethes aeneus TaxID=1431903 RepID=A0A9P0FLJ7_BRAAE|nr:unnamed protein product [Brassicogethes aeneus]